MRSSLYFRVLSLGGKKKKRVYLFSVWLKKVIDYMSYVDTGIVWVVDPWLCYKLFTSYNFAMVASHDKHLFKNMKYLDRLSIVLGPRDSVHSV